ncbi:MAG: hypothetical protein NT068_02575 [Candidatus Nomurabacteria bacterium]|nr:hypothetical protein [Candidatus Nomurabacteria bacterium]
MGNQVIGFLEESTSVSLSEISNFKFDDFFNLFPADNVIKQESFYRLCGDNTHSSGINLFNYRCTKDGMSPYLVGHDYKESYQKISLAHVSQICELHFSSKRNLLHEGSFMKNIFWLIDRNGKDCVVLVNRISGYEGWKAKIIDFHPHQVVNRNDQLFLEDAFKRYRH